MLGHKEKEDFCKIMREFPGKGYKSYSSAFDFYSSEQ